MGKQRHDIGWKKQQPASRPAPIASTDGLAHKLVAQGLASPRILESSPKYTDSRSN